MHRSSRLLATFATCVALSYGCATKSNTGETPSSTGGSTDGATTDGASTGGTTAGDTNATVAPNIPSMPAKCATTTAPDATITVTTKQGPQGGAPLVVDNKLYGMNIDDKQPGDWNVTTPNAAFVAYLKGLKPALLRFPNGYYGQTYQYSPTGAQTNGFTGLSSQFIDRFMVLCKAVGAMPLMAVNIAGTTQNAKDYVTYVNKTKAYGVTWWQLGNEPDVEGWTTAKNPNQYAAAYLSFVSAMSSVDTSIKFVGGEVMTGADIMGTYGSGNPDWATPILQGIASRPPDAFAWHYYPMDSSQTSTTSSATPSPAHMLQEDATDWPPAGLDFATKVDSKIKSLLASYAPKAQIWVDEFAEDSGKANGEGTGNIAAGALWAADSIGRFAETGTNAMFKFIFKGGPEHFYTMLDSNNVPRAEYYTYWMYAQHWGDHVVASTSDQIASVNAHSAIRQADGTLRVMLVNKTTTAKNVRLTLPDFKPTASAQYTLTATSLTSTTVSLNGTNLTDATVGNGETAIPMNVTANSCQDNVINIPALSATMLLFAP